MVRRSCLVELSSPCVYYLYKCNHFGETATENRKHSVCVYECSIFVHMAKEKKKRKKLLQKLLNRYRLVVINETTFEEESFFRLSRLNVIIAAIMLFFALFTLSFLFVAYTPLKELIPGKSSAALRQEALKNRDLLDSIMKQQEFQDKILFVDTFTPKTITKYTNRVNGTLYGSPKKFRDGRTQFKNLFIAGTDQGSVGIVGAMLGGIAIANNYILQGS